MSDEMDAIINIRVPHHLKMMLQELAEVAGVSVSAMGRLLWERDLYAVDGNAREFADRIAAAHANGDAAAYARQARVRLSVIDNAAEGVRA
jgi:hypothetical protein